MSEEVEAMLLADVRSLEAELKKANADIERVRKALRPFRFAPVPWLEVVEWVVAEYLRLKDEEDARNVEP